MADGRQQLIMVQTFLQKTVNRRRQGLFQFIELFLFRIAESDGSPGLMDGIIEIQRNILT